MKSVRVVQKSGFLSGRFAKDFRNCCQPRCIYSRSYQNQTNQKIALYGLAAVGVSSGLGFYLSRKKNETCYSERTAAKYSAITRNFPVIEWKNPFIFSASCEELKVVKDVAFGAGSNVDGGDDDGSIVDTPMAKKKVGFKVITVLISVVRLIYKIMC